MNKNIIIVSTEKSAGKSLICTIICRYLKNANLKVTPFKGVAISDRFVKVDRNIIISKEQAIQAEACEINISTDINPILIKIDKENVEKLYINGQSYCDFDIDEYTQIEEEIKINIINAFQKIRDNNDIAIIEGSGACNTVVKNIANSINFELDEFKDAKAILVSNMDRDSGFASLYGTLSLLDEIELKKIKGIILNRFEGKKEYLKNGIELIEDKFNIPIIGILPTISFDIENQKVIVERYYKNKKNTLNVGIVKLPNMWKKTDFYPLETDSNIQLDYIETCEDLKGIDLIIVPGTKKIFDDLQWLKNNGLDKKLVEAKKSNKVIIGIGSGYDILGESIRDEYGIEGKQGVDIDGIGLLPTKITYTLAKRTKITKGEIVIFNTYLNSISNNTVFGYECINGEFQMLEGCKPFVVDAFNNIIGIVNDEENVFGIHLHGLFESNEFRHNFFNSIKKRFNVVIQDKVQERKHYLEYKRKKYDMLVEEFKNYVNIELLDQILKED